MLTFANRDVEANDRVAIYDDILLNQHIGSDNGVINDAIIVDSSIIPYVAVPDNNVVSDLAFLANNGFVNARLLANECVGTYRGTVANLTRLSQHHFVFFVDMVELVGIRASFEQIRVGHQRIAPSSQNVATYRLICPESFHTSGILGAICNEAIVEIVAEDAGNMWSANVNVAINEIVSDDKLVFYVLQQLGVEINASFGSVAWRNVAIEETPVCLLVQHERSRIGVGPGSMVRVGVGQDHRQDVLFVSLLFVFMELHGLAKINIGNYITRHKQEVAGDESSVVQISHGITN